MFNVEYIYRIIDRFSGPLKKISMQTERFAAQADKAAKRASMMGQKMRDAGSRMSVGLSLPIVGAGIAAAKTAIDFQDAFIGVRKTVDATQPQLMKMREQFLKMSTEIPLSATALMGIGESAGQLGIQTKNITSFTKTIAMLGATTNLTGEEGATQLARFANITQMSQENFDRLGSTIVYLGNNLATTEAEIVGMGMRLAGAGNVVGLTESQIMGMAGTLTSLGINADAGGTAFSKVMMKINDAVANGGQMLDYMAKTAGMSSKQLADTFKKDASKGILSFVEGLGRLRSEGKNVNATLEAMEFNDIRVKDALLRASGSGDLFRKAMEMGNKAWNENNALVKEADLRFSSWSSQLKMAWNRIKLLANTMGQIIVPIFIKFVDLALPILEWFAGMNTTVKTTIVVLGGIVAAIGPVLLGLGWASTLFPVLATGAGMAATAIGWVAGGFALISAPIWLIIGAVAALTAGFVLAWKYSAQFRQSISNLGDAFSPLKEALQMIIDMLGGGVSNELDKSAEHVRTWGEVFQSMGDIVAPVIDMIAAMIKTALQGASKLGKLLGAVSMGEWKDAWNILNYGESKYDKIGKTPSRGKASARADDKKMEVTGQIGVTAGGGATVEKAEISVNRGYNLAVSGL